jgi:hypothetical protein
MIGLDCGSGEVLLLVHHGLHLIKCGRTRGTLAILRTVQTRFVLVEASHLSPRGLELWRVLSRSEGS